MNSASAHGYPAAERASWATDLPSAIPDGGRPARVNAAMNHSQVSTRSPRPVPCNRSSSRLP